MGAPGSVGNDIVDLTEPAIQSSHLSVRFVCRVCGERERPAIERALDPRLELWSRFAAKEAAYKALVKHRAPAPILSLPAFEVAEDLTHVRFEDIRVKLRVTRGSTWVHAVAWVGDRAAPTAVVESLPDGLDASQGVRTVATREIAAALGVETQRVEIRRDERPHSASGFGPPYTIVEGRRVAVDLSLSHDGPFGACAILV